MTGNKQQQTHTKQLLAGVPLNIDQQCEFIFIDQGEDLDFTVGDSRLSGRKAGDFARFDRPVDSVRVVSPYDQTIKLVLGFGEFSRLIVSGELNVSSYVTTRGNGQAKSLPFPVTKTVGVESLGVVEDVYGTVHATSSATSTFSSAMFWFDGAFYKLETANVYKFSPDSTDGTLDGTFPLGDGAANLAGVTLRGAAARSDGRVYFHANQKLFSLSLGDYSVTTELAIFGTDSTKNPFNGGAMIGDRFYVAYCKIDDNANGLDDYFLSYDTYTGEVFQFTANAPLNHTVSGGIVGYQGRYVLTTNNGSGSWATFDLLGGKSSEYLGNHPDIKIASTVRATSPDGRFGCVDSANSISVRVIQSRTFYGALFVQDGSDTATKKVVLLDSAPNYFVRGAGYVFKLAVVELILKAYGYETENYLDYVTEVTAGDGYLTKTVGSGTQSFVVRGLTDTLPVFLDSEVSFKILPEFFEQ